jgi:O-antigen/teichoic acid export membrane protein
MTQADRLAEELPAQRNLRINTYSLIASNLLTGLLGLVFWGAAARLYPAEAVGVGAAVLNSAVMLSALSLLSIDALFERFLPSAGVRTGPLLTRGFLLVAGVALVAGIAAVTFGPDELFESGWMMVLYPLVVVGHALFTLEDKATAGLGVARWAAAKNTVHAVAKLVALVALAWTGAALSMVLAWATTGAVIVAVVLLAMRRRYSTDPQFLGPPTLPPVRQILRYSGSSIGITAVSVIAPLALPLIVLSQFGAVANAHFTVAWAMVGALYMTVHLIVSPYIAEVAAHPDKVRTLSLRMMGTMAVASLVGSIALVTVGPFALGLVGGEYRAEGEGLLYLAALFIPLSAITAIYEGFARVNRKLGFILAVRGVAAVLIAVGSYVAVPIYGVIGVGWVHLVIEAVTAAIFLLPVLRHLKRNKQDPGWLARSVARNDDDPTTALPIA